MKTYTERQVEFVIKNLMLIVERHVTRDTLIAIRDDFEQWEKDLKETIEVLSEEAK